MRDAFSGRYRPTDKEFDRLWKEGIFVFDANVLLNLYRYSAKAQEQLISVLNVLKERTWLPHQAAKEFTERRIEVIHNRRKTYQNLKANLRKALSEVESQVGGLHRDGEMELAEPVEMVQDAVEGLVVRVQELEARVPEETNSLEDDAVWAAVEKIFEGRVGPPYAAERVKEIYKEGEERYARSIPPGYEDARKDKEPGSQADVGRRFGDLLLWYQALEQAKETQRPMVLVTDDRKEDWWWKTAGKTIGPRPELIEEVRHEAGVPFYMYRPTRFVEEAGRRELAGEGVSPEVLAEMDELVNLEQIALARKSQLDFLRTLAVETWGERGVGILESKIGKSLGDLTRGEADNTIDWLTPDIGFKAGSAGVAMFESLPEYAELREEGVPLSSYAGPLVEDLESSSFERQNKAVRALRATSDQELAGLDHPTQERLGRAVVAAARGVSHWGSYAARRLVEQLGQTSGVPRLWPEVFVRGMLLGALLSQHGQFNPTSPYFQPVVSWAQGHPQATDIFSRVSASVRNAEPLVDVTDATDWRPGKTVADVYDEVLDILNNLQVSHERVQSVVDGLIEAVRTLKNSGAPVET